MVILSLDISEDSFPFRGKISDGLLIDIKAPYSISRKPNLVSFDLTHKDGLIIHSKKKIDIDICTYNALIPDDNGILDPIPLTFEEFKDILPLLTECYGVCGFIGCKDAK